jgi:hypothetical protein
MTELTQKKGNFRYRILALVFMATTINYFDRSIVGVIMATRAYREGKKLYWDSVNELIVDSKPG